MQTISTEQLVYLLRSQVIPRIMPGVRNGIFVARKTARGVIVPEGVTLSRRKIVGKRTIIKNRRRYGNLRYFVADWPEDNLQELAVPKLVCVVSGVADYLLGNYCAHCAPGAFFIVPPMVPHQRDAPMLQGERRRNGSCVLLHAIAYKHGVQLWYSRSVNETYVNEPADNYLFSNLNVTQILHSLVDEAANEKPHFNSVAAGFLIAFFSIIAREIEAGNYMHPGPKENIRVLSRDEDFAQQVQNYVEANCHLRLRMDDVAAHLYMSRSQFSRRMQAEMNTTFLELLTNVRIERACLLLRETDSTAASIAGMLSFRSTPHFHALFHARMGCTPMEYRQKISQKIAPIP